ncbi:unnamed protein product [Gongylonema pulchrum]|uniref:Cadherin domain protein n=1 Tax=Gongylonema pulchrum TaxID=637853 RepID=A0A183CVG6_9BILA|nr:unnamed protein product [Gongylonema pulchrum]
MTEIVAVKAKDLDSGQNARISYRLSEESSVFGIHTASGSIFVKSVFDREKIAEYHILVIATDHGQPQLSSNATVQIKVLDVNDNSPICPTAAAATFTIAEDSDSGAVFGRVIASDPDEGLNGSLTYRLQVEDVNFAIKNNGELVLKRKLSSKELKKETRLSVIVLDRNGDSLARSVICPVRVVGVKAHSKVKFLEPVDRVIRHVFSQKSSVVRNNRLIKEECGSGCLLKVLNATNVAKWDIEKSDISRNFEIQNNTLRTSAHFNEAAIEDSRTLSVTAFDVNDRKRQITFTIRTAPNSRISPKQGEKTTVVRISKTARVGSRLATISKNRDSKSIWRLENETDMFYLDGVSSTLYLASSFRRTRDASYQLKVLEMMAPDYIHIEQHDLFVEVEPENLHWPRFPDCPQFFTVKENEPTGSMIGKVPGFDEDEGSAGQLSYSIVQGPLGLFSVDPDTAEILLTRPLRWEKDLSLFIVVEAEDNFRDITKRKRSRCVVFIDVEDINDHAPQFISSSNITVDADFVDGDIIHYVIANDEDDGQNAKITYTIIDGNMDDAFVIDPNSGSGWPHLELFSYFISDEDMLQLADDGKLLMMKKLMPGNYTYFVIATKSEQMADWASVDLTITGGNQYPPRISPSSCGNLTIRENVAAERLTRIYAHDQDDGADGEIFYKIVGKLTFKLTERCSPSSKRVMDSERVEPHSFTTERDILPTISLILAAHLLCICLFLCVFRSYAMRKTHIDERLSVCMCVSVCSQSLCTDFSSRDLQKLQG